MAHGVLKRILSGNSAGEKFPIHCRCTSFYSYQNNKATACTALQYIQNNPPNKLPSMGWTSANDCITVYPYLLNQKGKHSFILSTNHTNMFSVKSLTILLIIKSLQNSNTFIWKPLQKKFFSWPHKLCKLPYSTN